MKDVLKHNGFIGTVHYSTEDEVFYGKLMGIDDLITFEGASVQALKASFQEAVDDYLELCESAGKTPQKSYKGTFNVRINPNLHKQAAHRSLELGISLNQFVEEAIDAKLTEDKASTSA